MTIAQITTNAQLREYMTTPTPGVIECVRNVPGDLLILGGSGKMGPELTEMIVRADTIAGTSRKITVASTFSNPRERTVELFAELGVTVMKGELTDPAFLDTLPVTPNVIYMPGFKFGSSDNWEKAVHVNCILPYLVGERFPARASSSFPQRIRMPSRRSHREVPVRGIRSIRRGSMDGASSRGRMPLRSPRGVIRSSARATTGSRTHSIWPTAWWWILCGPSSKGKRSRSRSRM